MTDVKKEYGRLIEENSKLKAELEALKDQEQRAQNYCKNTCEPNYKAEVERLKKCVAILKDEVGKRERGYDPSEEIDNLLKEMVGDDNA